MKLDRAVMPIVYINVNIEGQTRKLENCQNVHTGTLSVNY